MYRFEKIGKENLEKDVKEQNCITDVLRLHKMPIRKYYYDIFRKYCNKWDIKYDHFNSYHKNKHTSFGQRIHTKDNFFKIHEKRINCETIRRILLENNLKEEKCEICNILPIWNNKPLVLQIDHINGNHCDNKLENLRFVCPNCHTQTSTYSGKNIKVEKKVYHCKKCDNQVSKYCKTLVCSNCQKNDISKRKVKNRPSLETLEKDVKEFGYRASGRKYNVSDNTIRKWIKKYKNNPQ